MSDRLGDPWGAGFSIAARLVESTDHGDWLGRAGRPLVMGTNDSGDPATGRVKAAIAKQADALRKSVGLAKLVVL